MHDSPQAKQTHYWFAYATGAERFFSLKRLDYEHITHLTITVDASKWTDYEDDMWTFGLAGVACNNNLTHLTLNIEGANLFTEDNYMAPVIWSSEEYKSRTKVKAPRSPSDEEAKAPAARTSAKASIMATTVEEDEDEEAEAEAEEGNEERHEPVPVTVMGPPAPPNKKARTTRSGQQPSAAPTPAPKKPDDEKKYESKVSLRNKKGPIPDIPVHIYSKQIVKAIIGLKKTDRQIQLSITGPMTLSLRWKLLDSLCPGWRTDGLMMMQGGLEGEEMAAKVKEVHEAEQNMLQGAVDMKTFGIPVGFSTAVLGGSGNGKPQTMEKAEIDALIGGGVRKATKGQGPAIPSLAQSLDGAVPVPAGAVNRPTVQTRGTKRTRAGATIVAAIIADPAPVEQGLNPTFQPTKDEVEYAKVIDAKEKEKLEKLIRGHDEQGERGGLSYGFPLEWVPPTSYSGRHVLGWKATKAWKGPILGQRRWAY
jgi:hypothetical protein